MRVGFIGVGAMGAPIARNILKGGFALAVYDVDGAAVDRLGNGSATKVVNNYLALSIAAAAAESLALGARAGLSVEHMLDVFRATMAANAQVDQVMRTKALADDFTPGFMVRLGHKDLRLALDMARAFGVNTPVGSAAFDAFGEACRLGLERQDVSSILRVREDEAGIRIRLSGR